MAGGDVSYSIPSAGTPELIVRWGGRCISPFWRCGGWASRSWPACTRGAGAGFSLLCAADLATRGGHQVTLAYANIGASPDGGSTLSCRGCSATEGDGTGTAAGPLRRREGAHFVW